MNGLTFVLLVLGAGLALLVFNHDSGQTFGIANEDFGQMIYLLPIAGLLSVGILAGNRGGLTQVLRYIAVWLVIILALVAAYIYRYDLQQVGARLSAGLIPGSAVEVTTAQGVTEVIIHRGIRGHFHTSASVNGQAVSMLVDTGASAVVLSFEDAERIGLEPQRLAYTVTVSTANGRATAAPVRLDEVAIGPILRRDVRAMVAEEGRLDQSLLGMTFLSTLGSIQMQTDELRLRD
ncbi:TIGR02281 family clan AA aspartic protease [Pseudorhizobium halotolerans]|uniref:TIGR02281 family clan AA aspartic protease n=1 Tax=Pseudorhizobium halotolerans TaxID=1233081 RepID=A0ABM8PJQ1_9HYPH|nr:TIGR02281 family clan AA aspartic protease [Pseudorhizobium halotolerans]CAD7033705.1 TIGR02281 family clan AA aspartic protease [Pseudorhizobium halotolerans]